MKTKKPIIFNYRLFTNFLVLSQVYHKQSCLCIKTSNAQNPNRIVCVTLRYLKFDLTLVNTNNHTNNGLSLNLGMNNFDKNDSWL